VKRFAVLAIGVVALSSAGGAATAGEPFQVFEVEKVVEGTPPPGTEFVVEVECTQFQGPPITETLTFTESGVQTVDAGGGSMGCEATETENGGASSVEVTCEAFEEASCTSDNAVEYTSDVASARVTFTNRFDPPPPPPPPEAVSAEPVFTG
jgi:hypothetical protein